MMNSWLLTYSSILGFMLSKLKVIDDGSIRRPGRYLVSVHFILVAWIEKLLCLTAAVIDAVLIKANKLANISVSEQFHWSLTHRLNDAVLIDKRGNIWTDWTWGGRGLQSNYLQCSDPLVYVVTEWLPAPQDPEQSDVWCRCVCFDCVWLGFEQAWSPRGCHLRGE